MSLRRPTQFTDSAREINSRIERVNYAIALFVCVLYCVARAVGSIVVLLCALNCVARVLLLCLCAIVKFKHQHSLDNAHHTPTQRHRTTQTDPRLHF
jgi:uncharacterized membrane protein